MRFRTICLSTWLVAAGAAGAAAQTILSQYKFDGDLTNSSTFVDANAVAAPNGTFKEGRVSATAVTGTATFGTGVDGSANSALVLDGFDDWVDVTTAGHPGEPIPAVGPSPEGMISGTVMAWVKMNSSASARSQSLMGSSNDNDYQAWQAGWNGSRLEAIAHANDSPATGIVVGDSTSNTSWADGEWHHLAIKWNGFSDLGGVYLDGVPLATDVTSGLDANSPQSPWQFPMALGARNNGGNLESFWDGMIDDLRVYELDLSDANIESIVSETPVRPDFDNDDDVDGADFFTWQRNFGTGTTFAEGDANGSLTVDGTDLALWKGAFGGSVVAAAALQAVPEPASAALLLLGTMGLWGRRRRPVLGSY